MPIVRSVREMRARSDERRRAGRRIVLVPTMGALHAGHLSLVREGLEHGDDLIVSIFVNPTQFGPGEDYRRYPRPLDKDIALLESTGADVTLFTPEEDEMYPGGMEANVTWISVDGLNEHLCGRHRPGHFRGVATVVAKLFNACRPDVAMFGLKDAQQFVILERMVQDLHFDVQLVGVPTVRHEDGLARSSRNMYLNSDERRQAVVLSRAVFQAEQLVRQGEVRPQMLIDLMQGILAEASGARVQYAEVVDAETLQPLDGICPGQRVLMAVAVYFGSTRLIDNVFVRAPVK